MSAAPKSPARMRSGKEARTVRYVDLAAQFDDERSEIEAIVQRIFSRGQFIGGDPVDLLEEELASYCGTSHAVALSSGTDALMLAMMALGIGAGDEVITPPNSFIASTASIIQIGATPVFADVQPDQNLDPKDVAARITPRTKAIMPVHLTGRVAPMIELCELADRHGLLVIEDAAQSFGSMLMGRQSGSFGDVGCFSAHPLKNLNAAGDAGFVLTENGEVARKIKLLRNHGLKDRDVVEIWGFVARLDSFQAELLRMRLRRLPGVIESRRQNAARYQERIATSHVAMPPSRPEEFNTFHTFVVQADRRDELRDFLSERGIQTAIHYPVPIHLQPAAKQLGYRKGSFPVTESQAGRILTLPIHQYLKPDEIDYVAEMVDAFYRR